MSTPQINLATEERLRWITDRLASALSAAPLRERAAVLDTPVVPAARTVAEIVLGRLTRSGWRAAST